MLELPESASRARELRAAVLGKRVERVKAGESEHRFAFFFGPPEDYPELLEGRRIDGAEPCAGLVELSFGEIRLVFGDGVNLRLLGPGEPLPRKHQLDLLLDDGSHLVCTVQMYGGLWAFAEGENDNPYYLVAREKPSPLGELFDEAYFRSLFEGVREGLSAKAFLAAEQRIPGLGNGVLQDILFRAGIHPRTPVNCLNDQDRERLFHCVKDTLAEMTRLGGRDTERDLFGEPGGYRTCLSKNTWKEPCPVCGGAILRQTYLGGNVYFCPHCQPLTR